MRRRQLLASLPLALARPALAAEPRVLVHVPQANLTSLDPVWTTAVVTRNAAHLLFETLYGRDEALNPQPQMVEGHRAEDGAHDVAVRRAAIAGQLPPAAPPTRRRLLRGGAPSRKPDRRIMKVWA